MNIIDGSLLKDTAILNPLLQQFERTDIVIGIRPSDVVVSAQDNETALEGEVLLLEPTGSDMWVDVLWKEIKIKGRMLAEEKTTSGARAFFKIPLEKLHIFDKADGERLA
jgi:ABC-type sugar transport system ATPase subunit